MPAFPSLDETPCKTYLHKWQHWLHSETVVIAWMGSDNLQKPVVCKMWLTVKGRVIKTDWRRLWNISLESVYTPLPCLEEGPLQKHLLTRKSFCRDIQNSKLFSSISFSFGCVYYYVVTLPTLWSEKKSSFWQSADLASICIVLLEWFSINFCWQYSDQGIVLPENQPSKKLHNVSFQLNPWLR